MQPLYIKNVDLVISFKSPCSIDPSVRILDCIKGRLAADFETLISNIHLSIPDSFTMIESKFISPHLFRSQFTKDRQLIVLTIELALSKIDLTATEWQLDVATYGSKSWNSLRQARYDLIDEIEQWIKYTPK